MERRSQFLLIFVMPCAVTLVTIAMSVGQGAKTLFVSDTMNLPRQFEPWPLFTLRWSLWHSAFISIWWFKRSVFPPKLQWVAWLDLVLGVGSLYSGFCNIDPSGYAGSWRHYLHDAFGGAVLVGYMVETPALWVESTRTGLLYIGVGLFYLVYFVLAVNKKTPDTGIPLIRYDPEALLEWWMMYVHTILLYANYPRLRREGFKRGLCGCCCFGLKAKGEGEGEPCRAFLEVDAEAAS